MANTDNDPVFDGARRPSNRYGSDFRAPADMELGVCEHGEDRADCNDCNEEVREHISNTIGNEQRGDEATDTMDEMIQRASTPSLATLFKAGKAAGLIQPGKEYGESA